MKGKAEDNYFTLEYSESQRLFHCEDPDDAESRPGWVKLRVMRYKDIDRFCRPIEEKLRKQKMSFSEIKKMLDEFYTVKIDGLTLEGFSKKGGPLSLIEVNEVRRFIRKSWSKQASINTIRTSYGLKHDAEKAMGVYVANGTLIAAMIMEGYKYKIIGRNGPNVFFNVDYQSVLSKKSGVYLIHDESAGLYKIGKSRDIQKRFNQIRSHNPVAKLVWTSDSVDEAYLHGVFKSKRVFREWFRLENEDIEFMKQQRWLTPN